MAFVSAKIEARDEVVPEVESVRQFMQKHKTPAVVREMRVKVL